MALIVASYPDPTNPPVPITNAYAWVFHIGLNMGMGTYWVEIWIQKDEAVASLFPPPAPLARITIETGTVLIPGTPGTPAIPAIPAYPGRDADPANGLEAMEPTDEVPGVPAVDGIPDVVAPTLIEVFDRAAAAQAANPALTPLLAFRQVVYEIVAQYSALSPNMVV